MASKNKFIVEQLTDSELRKLKRAVTGYGKFTQTAEKAGLHPNTLKGVILRGHGVPETIEKVRTKVLAA